MSPPRLRTLRSAEDALLAAAGGGAGASLVGVGAGSRFAVSGISPIPLALATFVASAGGASGFSAGEFPASALTTLGKPSASIIAKPRRPSLCEPPPGPDRRLICICLFILSLLTLDGDLRTASYGEEAFPVSRRSRQSCG